MSRVQQLSVVGTMAAVLVTVLSVVLFRRGEVYAEVRSYELVALPSAVVMVVLLAFIVFRCLVPLAELLDRPVLFGLGMSVIGLGLILLSFWFGVFSIDWGFLGGLSVVMGVGGALAGGSKRRPHSEDLPWQSEIQALVNETKETRPSASTALPYLTVAGGLLVIVTNLVTFALDVLGRV